MKKSNRKALWFICLTALGSLAVYLSLPQHAERQFESPGAVFTVMNNSDSGAGSFRQAITDANAQPGTDTIQFQIGTGAVSITLSSALPDITETVIIDGTTQPGFSGTPLIMLSGQLAFPGLKTIGGSTTIKALAFINFPNGITLENGGGNIIMGCYIGIDPQNPTTGGNSQNGILINNSPNNQIGGSTAAELNIIGSNTADGIRITGNASTGNIVTGNYIGIRAPGTLARNNQSAIAIVDAPNNRVGGTTPAERNVLVGSNQGSDLPGNQSKSGVLISGVAASGNVVEGNFIGTDIDGTTGVGGMRFNGVRIDNAPNNRVGGTTGTTPGGACTGACNVIAGIAFRGGVYITGAGATGNTVLGNFIGTNAAGTAIAANNVGVTITAGASNNAVGGTTAAARNLITDGMTLTAGATANTVEGNYIGTDTTGTVAIGRGTLFQGIAFVAVLIDSSTNNRIGTVTGTTLGGACTGGCNLISSNSINFTHGVYITGAGSTGNRVDYNYIGLNAAGTAALRNGGDAITLRDGANNNIIGRPLQTSFQETSAVENIPEVQQRCAKDELTGNAITFNDVTGEYTLTSCRLGVTRTGFAEIINQGGIIKVIDRGVFLVFDTFDRKASGYFITEDIRSELRDTNTDNNDSCACPTEGLQVVVGTITNGINNDPNPPNNNDFNSNSLGCSANGINNLSSETLDGNFINRAGSFNDYSNNSACTRGENESVIVRAGTDNVISNLATDRLIQQITGQSSYFFREIDLHDDNTTNQPVPNPGPGANRSQNSIQNFEVRYESVPGPDTLGVRMTATFNSTPNTRFRVQLYGDYTDPDCPIPACALRRNRPLLEPFEVTTDANGNADINRLFTGMDALYAETYHNVTSTATVLNPSGNAPGDTSEMSLPAPVPKPQFDFDFDGKTDFTVYRPGAGATDLSYWFVLNSRDFTVRIVQFGNGEDKIVPGDYQGDGAADFAVFRPSTGTWYHSRLTGDPSTNFVGFQWGFSTDIPVIGDYDGDGATDAAVFRPSERVWYVRRSIDGSLLANQFGLATDKLVPADYNGDGVTDFAIYRNGQWWISPCAGCPASVINFGLGTDDPVPGVDFNGDGADDIAVTRNEGANKIWHWLESGTGNYRVAHFGLSSDKVLVGDFDADNKFDLAVFRPSEGNWYGFGSEQGFFVLRWGLNTDIPVPSAHLP